VSDHCAITNLIHRYAELIDAGDLDAVADLFAHGEVSNEGFPEAARGRDEVLALYAASARVHGDGTLRTKHVTTNAIVEIDADAGTATCRSYFTVLQQTASLPLQPIICGRYHDRFERVDGTWRFAKRHIFTDLFGELGEHLLFDAAALRR
jgi:3-phenylpropionate/cinnamic acid dioxygenase small subunit